MHDPQLSTTAPAGPRRRRTRGPVVALAATALMTGGVTYAVSAHAATAGCQVTYTVSSQWSGGFNADVAVKNLGDPINGWSLKWTFPAPGQAVTQGWNATFATSGSTVTATNATYNAAIATGASTSIGFSGAWTSSNPVPTGFTLNGTACTGSTSTPGPSGTPAQSPSPSPSSTGGGTTTGLVGWAATNGGTSGGAGGSTVTVTTAAALDSALQSSGAATVRISGMITLSGMHRVAANKTVIGVGSGSGVTGGGLNVSGVRNVIIRNLVFRGADDDAINVEGSTNVWIDHNDLATGYDGLVDIKRGADFVTVSWNHVHNHDKVMLLGHSDDNGAQDIGHLRVTYHHNWFDGTTQRHPRVRFGNPVHVYNNYYNGIGSYGVASTCNAGVLVEGNYFENTRVPYQLGAGDSPAGSLVARNNYLTGSGGGQTGGSVASIPYSYPLDTPSSVKSVVTAGAGTGRV